MRRFLLAVAMCGVAAGAHAADMPDLPILRGAMTEVPPSRLFIEALDDHRGRDDTPIHNAAKPGDTSLRAKPRVSVMGGRGRRPSTMRVRN